jgi:hypothetical protein
VDERKAGTKRVLVVGAPRSGTTWVGRTLGHASGAGFVREPDNPINHPFAIRAKRALGRFPVLSPGDPASPDYERLWTCAFDATYSMALPVRVLRHLRLRAARRVVRMGSLEPLRSPFPDPKSALPFRLRMAGRLGFPLSRPPLTKHAVVKSVFAALALEWIHDRWQPEITIVLRDPLNVIASWVELGYSHIGLYRHPLVVDRYLRRWRIEPPDPSASPLASVAWQVGFLTCVLEDLAERHPDWRVVVHEDLCQDPVRRLRELCGDLGLEWTSAAEDFVSRSNRPGKAYATNRVARELPDSWQRRLQSEQVEEILPVLARFPSRRFALKRLDRE